MYRLMSAFVFMASCALLMLVGSSPADEISFKGFAHLAAGIASIAGVFIGIRGVIAPRD